MYNVGRGSNQASDSWTRIITSQLLPFRLLERTRITAYTLVTYNSEKKREQGDEKQDEHVHTRVLDA